MYGNGGFGLSTTETLNVLLQFEEKFQGRRFYQYCQNLGFNLRVHVVLVYKHSCTEASLGEKFGMGLMVQFGIKT